MQESIADISKKTYLRQNEVALLYNLPECWLEKMRVKGGGPPFVKLSRRFILYKKESVDKWLEALEVKNTIEGKQQAGKL